MKFTDEEIANMTRSVCDADKCDPWGGHFWTLTQQELARLVAAVAAKAEGTEKRADALAATVAALRDVVTTDAETKEEFVSRVRAVLGEDPDARVLGAVLAERERCAMVLIENSRCCNHPFHREALESNAAAIRALK